MGQNHNRYGSGVVSRVAAAAAKASSIMMMGAAAAAGGSVGGGRASHPQNFMPGHGLGWAPLGRAAAAPPRQTATGEGSSDAVSLRGRRRRSRSPPRGGMNWVATAGGRARRWRSGRMTVSSGEEQLRARWAAHCREVHSIDLPIYGPFLGELSICVDKNTQVSDVTVSACRILFGSQHLRFTSDDSFLSEEL